MVREDNVIDNRQVVLRDELVKILPETSEASIAVGYFFISGLAAIIEPLSGVEKTRLLISTSTNAPTAEALLEGYHNFRTIRKEVEKTNYVNNDRKAAALQDASKNMKESLERMTQTDVEKNAVQILIDMITEEKLEVRIYPKEKLHAKAYLFESRSSNFVQGVGIVGSSNLSIAGMSQNSELNLKTYHSPDLRQLLEWFDDLWKVSVPFDDKLKMIMLESWAGKTYSPYELFLKAAYIEHKDKLEEQHKIDPVWGTMFPNLFQFQKNAVDQSLTMFELYGGVIIGDVVGLGKTYVGIALLKYLQLEGCRAMIVCPPSLVSMWEKFCEDYEVDAKVLSRGMLSQENFDLYRDYRYKSRDLVLIDESHHFRNNNTRQYENLLQFMQARDARAILLTATPFSNTADDIKNQIMLFHRSPITQIPPANETNLDTYFKEVNNGEANLVDLLRNIMIRRTRRYVLAQWGHTDKKGQKYLMIGKKKMYFPQRKMKTMRYDINKVYKRKYQTIVEYIDEKNLTLARYGVGRYLKDEYKNVEPYRELNVAGPKLVGLIRTLLLKRMESSIEAFKSSIRHYIATHTLFIKLLEEGIMPIGDVSYTSMYELAQSDPDAIDDPATIDEFKKKLRKAGKPRYKLDAFNVDSLMQEVQNDIETFEKIEGLIGRLTPNGDEKLQRLQRLLNRYSGKKVIVFTEFSTTAKYLNRHIKWVGNKEQVDSSTNNIIQSARRFDPKNNPLDYTTIDLSDEITLLITTDVLAEGVNLQAGNVVINYDFHWNPTRLIQRAGRVDRIGSKNNTIHVHNFLLDPAMEEDLGLEFAVDTKIDSIQKIIGEDHKILKESERINTDDNYAIYRGDSSILDHEESNPLEPTHVEKLLQEIQLKNPDLWKIIQTIPDAIQSSDGSFGKSGKLLLACESCDKNGEKFQKRYIVSNDNSVEEIRGAQAIQLLESADDVPYPLPSQYNRLLAEGWSRFIADIEQIEARSKVTRLKPAQTWILERLMKAARLDKFKDQKDMIETLRKAFSTPITAGKLAKELNKIRNSKISDADLIENLSHLYRHYDLQNKTTVQPHIPSIQRILYSRYIGDAA